MYLHESEIWINDIDEVIAAFPMLQEFENCSVLITGATGLICSAIVDLFLRYNDTHDNSIQILVAGRNKENVKARFGECMNRSDFIYLSYDAQKEISFCNYADYIIHGASNAYPSAIMKEPVETMLSNFLGMKNLLEFAHRQGTKRLLYVSTSEVYGQKSENVPSKENEYGYIDILKTRNSYSIGKQATETLCVSYADEYKVESVIARPGHIYGPTASCSDNRVATAWAYAAAKGENLVMKSEGSQLRSYCYCLDCASAILMMLLKGESCQAYNISNPESVISVKDIGEMMANVGGVNLIRMEATEEDKKGFNPMSNSALDSSSLISLGWRGLFDAKRGFFHTVKILKEMNGIKTETSK